MQESGVTAASDREGECPWFLGFFHRWERVCFSLPRRIEECAPLLVRACSKLLETSTVMGFRARHARIGLHCMLLLTGKVGRETL